MNMHIHPEHHGTDRIAGHLVDPTYIRCAATNEWMVDVCMWT